MGIEAGELLCLVQKTKEAIIKWLFHPYEGPREVTGGGFQDRVKAKSLGKVEKV